MTLGDLWKPCFCTATPVSAKTLQGFCFTPLAFAHTWFLFGLPDHVLASFYANSNSGVFNLEAL